MFTNKTFFPCKELAPYISSILILESESPVTVNIFPQPNASLSFIYKGTMICREEDRAYEVPASTICGPRTIIKQRLISCNSGIIIVRFREGGATSLFDCSIHDFFCENITLDTFFSVSEIARVEEQLSATRSPDDKIKVLEQFLCSRIHHDRSDDLILEATARIRDSRGTLKIGDLCRHLYISQSQFEKRFRRSVGTSAKKYASLIRISGVLSTDGQEGNITDKAYDAGYFDQAHFIKDFKAYTGITPHRFFKISEENFFGNGPFLHKPAMQ